MSKKNGSGRKQMKRKIILGISMIFLITLFSTAFAADELKDAKLAIIELLIEKSENIDELNEIESIVRDVNNERLSREFKNKRDQFGDTGGGWDYEKIILYGIVLLAILFGGKKARDRFRRTSDEKITEEGKQEENIKEKIKKLFLSKKELLLKIKKINLPKETLDEVNKKLKEYFENTPEFQSVQNIVKHKEKLSEFKRYFPQLKIDISDEFCQSLKYLINNYYNIHNLSHEFDNRIKINEKIIKLIIKNKKIDKDLLKNVEKSYKDIEIKEDKVKEIMNSASAKHIIGEERYHDFLKYEKSNEEQQKLLKAIAQELVKHINPIEDDLIKSLEQENDNLDKIHEISHDIYRRLASFYMVQHELMTKYEHAVKILIDDITKLDEEVKKEEEAEEKVEESAKSEEPKSNTPKPTPENLKNAKQGVPKGEYRAETITKKELLTYLDKLQDLNIKNIEKTDLNDNKVLEQFTLHYALKQLVTKIKSNKTTHYPKEIKGKKQILKIAELCEINLNVKKAKGEAEKEVKSQRETQFNVEED